MKSKNHIIKTFFLALIAIFLVSCSSTSTVSQKEETKEKKLTYLALGDSYTVGEMVDKEESFPYLLVKELEVRAYNFDNPMIVAKTGWRTDELLKAMKEVELTEKVDLVSILIGVNNQYQNIPKKVFRAELKLIIEQAINFSKRGTNGIFAFSIPDYSVTPFMRGKNIEKVSEDIKRYNKIYKELCDSYEIPFFNITPLSREAKKDHSYVADDKLHPSAKMYQMWVEKNVDQIVREALQ